MKTPDRKIVTFYCYNCKKFEDRVVYGNRQVLIVCKQCGESMTIFGTGR
jgi:ribosomal protein S27E